jgi:predicted DNA-binding protein (MmcQ/YjbR family)
MNKSDVREQLRVAALALPGAWEDHPWGETVVKVRKKIFVFLGLDETEPYSVGVKLTDSHALGLAVPGAAPSGYGLGKAGWVKVPITLDGPSVDVLADFVEESYRNVAPKKLIADLDAAGG